MWTLALETASAHGSLALLCGEGVAAVVALEPRNYSGTLLDEIERLLGGQGIGLHAVDLLAAADGPGSFTGVRIGLATVKGLIEVLGQPAVTVSTLRAAAGEAALVALDAGRGEVYYGAYPKGAEGVEPLDAFRQRLAQGRGRAVTPDAALCAACPELELVSPLLAPAVGRLGLDEYRAGRVQDALRLDARYLGQRWGG